MKRKHSITLMLAIIITLLYLAFLCWHIYRSYDEYLLLLKYAQTADTEFSELILLPHLALSVVAFIFLVIGFFTNIFAMALTAGILFCVAAIAYIMYAPFLIPSCILSFVGSSFCYKRKKTLKEEEEERLYQQEKSVQPKPLRTVTTYAQDPIENQNFGYYQQGQTMQQTNLNSRPQMRDISYVNNQSYQNNSYEEDSYSPFDQNMMNNNYYNLEMQTQGQQVSENQVYYQANDAAMYQEPQDINSIPISSSTLINDGYFDDYGNFHSHSEGE